MSSTYFLKDKNPKTTARCQMKVKICKKKKKSSNEQFLLECFHSLKPCETFISPTSSTVFATARYVCLLKRLNYLSFLLSFQLPRKYTVQFFLKVIGTSVLPKLPMNQASSKYYSIYLNQCFNLKLEIKPKTPVRLNNGYILKPSPEIKYVAIRFHTPT